MGVEQLSAEPLSFESILSCEDPLAAVIGVVTPFGVFLFLALVDDDVRLDLAVGVERRLRFLPPASDFDVFVEREFALSHENCL